MPSPPPFQQDMSSANQTSTASASKDAAEAQAQTPSSSRPKGRRRVAKLKHLLRPHTEEEIELWKRQPWCRDSATLAGSSINPTLADIRPLDDAIAAYIQAYRDSRSGQEKARRKRGAHRNAGLPSKHTVARLDEILKLRGIERPANPLGIPVRTRVQLHFNRGCSSEDRRDEMLAHTQASKDVESAQRKAYRERARLKKAGRPYEHIFAPGIEHFLALRGFEKAGKHREDRTSVDASTHPNVAPATCAAEDSEDDVKCRPATSESHQNCPTISSWTQDEDALLSLSHQADDEGEDLDLDLAAFSATRETFQTIAGSTDVQDEPFPPIDQADNNDDGESDISTFSMPCFLCSAVYGGSQLVDVREGFERKRELWMRLAGLTQEELDASRGEEVGGLKRKRSDDSDDPECLAKKRERQASALPSDTESPTTQDETQQHCLKRSLLSPCDDWPCHFPSVSPLPTAPPSQKNQILQAIFDLTSMLGASKVRVDEAQKCYARLSDNLASVGVEGKLDGAERMADLAVRLTQLQEWAEGLTTTVQGFLETVCGLMRS